jgi:hypothetical protein
MRTGAPGHVPKWTGVLDNRRMEQVISFIKGDKDTIIVSLYPGVGLWVGRQVTFPVAAEHQQGGDLWFVTKELEEPLSRLLPSVISWKFLVALEEVHQHLHRWMVLRDFYAFPLLQE